MKRIDPSETEFLNLVVDYAHIRGWLVHHDRPAMNRHGDYRTALQGDAGFPDLVVARHGRVVFAELKSKAGRPTPAQNRWADHLRYDLGFESTFDYYLWRPEDWPMIEKLLK